MQYLFYKLHRYQLNLLSNFYTDFNEKVAKLFQNNEPFRSFWSAFFKIINNSPGTRKAYFSFKQLASARCLYCPIRFPTEKASNVSEINLIPVQTINQLTQTQKNKHRLHATFHSWNLLIPTTGTNCSILLNE